MEFGTPQHDNPFNRSPEGGKTSDSSEKKSEKTKDKKDQKLAGSAALRGEIGGAGKAPEKAADAAPSKQPPETMWQRLVASDRDIFGIQKPQSEAAAEQKTETTAEAGNDQEVAAEVRRATREFTEDRLRTVSQELGSLPPSEHGSLPAAEAAADAALLRGASERLATNEDVSPAEAIDAAGRQVAEDIHRSANGAENHPTDSRAAETIADTETADDGSESPQDDPDTAVEAADAVEVPEDMPGAAGDAEAGEDTAASPPAAGNASGPPPPRPPSGPPTAAAGGFPSGPNNQAGGNFYTTAPGYAAYNAWNMPPVTPAAPNTAPAAANVAPTPSAAVTAPVSSGREQAAAAKGLLAGGIIGYFVGRNRGRKQGAARAEQQNAPVRKALEAEARQLQQNVITKERQIRQLAHDKFEASAQAEARNTFVKRELQAQQAPRPAVRPEAVAAAVTAGAAAAESLSAAPETPPPLQTAAAETTHRSAAEALATPLVMAGELSIRGSKLDQAPAAELLVHDRHHQEREQAPVIPFNKKAKDFSRQELMATAEKVTVQGTTLKEMVELGRLDEPALRRVTQEFLDGRDVGAAVNREVEAKESFERDPQLRANSEDKAKQNVAAQADANSAQQRNGGAETGGGLLTALAGVFGTTSANAASAAKDQRAQPSGRQGQSGLPAPAPDDATLKELRERQMAMVAGTTLVVAVLAVIIALIVT